MALNRTTRPMSFWFYLAGAVVGVSALFSAFASQWSPLRLLEGSFYFVLVFAIPTLPVWYYRSRASGNAVKRTAVEFGLLILGVVVWWGIILLFAWVWGGRAAVQNQFF